MFGLRVPEEHGGLGLGMLASATFSEALGASTFAGFDVTVLVHTDMAGPHLLNSGSPEQHDRVGPEACCQARRSSRSACREPDAGSDVAGIRIVGCERRRWVADQRHARCSSPMRVYGDYDRRRPHRRRATSTASRCSSCRPAPKGSRSATKLDKHGWRCSDTAELVLDDVWVPDDHVLGTVHRGFYETMKNFQNERMVLSAWARRGTGRDRHDQLATRQERQGVRGQLYDLGAIRQRMAMNQAKLDAVRASMYHAAWLVTRARTT